MDIVTYLVGVFIILFIAVGGYYMVLSLMGPRKIEEIVRLMEKGRVQEAISQLNKILEKDDRDIRARFLLGQCQAKLGKNQEAVLEYRQCLKIGKFSPEAPEIQIRKNLAMSLLKLNNRNEAKNEFLILSTLQPDNYENFFEVGQLYHAAGIHAKAVNFLSKAAALNGNHAESFNLLGQSQFHLGSYNDARNSLTRAVQLKGTMRIARYFLGLTLRLTGDLEWALKELENAERDEKIRDRVLLAKGMVLIDQESYAKAIAELERAARSATPGTEISAQIFYVMGIAGEKNRDIHKAIESWEQVEKIKPGFRDVREKLRQYSEFRTDDRIKDIMIAGAAQFEQIGREIVTKMGYQVINLNMVADARLQIIAAEEDNQKMGARNKYTYFLIQRDMTAISENHIRDILMKMRENNAGKGLIMTTGDITPGASNFASTRPLDLYDSQRLGEFLRGILG